MQEISRFELAGDVRVMRTGKTETGGVALEESVAGTSCLVAYGEPARRARLSFDSAMLAGLCHALGRDGGASTDDALAALSDFARQEENELVDLMDLCDARGVAYAYLALGDSSGMSYRPARS